MEKVPITREGQESLRQELDRLLKEERPATIQAIEAARAHGDLSENAEYHAAKERQGFIEGRICELQVRLGQCQVIDIDRGCYDRAVFGAQVLLENIDTGEQRQIMLVGPFESDPERGRISISAPLGQALLGKEVGEEIRVHTPRGVQEMAIIEIA
jgi:transcription elongation factor GreA